MTSSRVGGTLQAILSCWLFLSASSVLAQERASSTDDVNRALGVDNLGRSNLLPSTGGSGKSPAVKPTADQPATAPSEPSPMRQWTGAISAAIHARMNPGAAAGTSGGSAVVRFTVLRSGEVKDVSLARSSGVDQIDRAALASVQGVLPAAPQGVTQQSLSVTMPLNYRVHSRGTGASPELGGRSAEPVAAATPPSAKLPLSADCQWSKANRADQSLHCPQDDASPPFEAVQPAENFSTLPIYDMDAKCASTVARASINECLERNQASYDLLKMMWSRVSEKNKERCNRVASGAVWAYYTLESCISQYEQLDSELEKAKKPPAAFRY